MKFSEITNDKEFWNDKKEYEKSIKKRYFRLRLIEENQSDSLKLKNLMENGLKAAPQGPTKVNDTLLSYIEEYFNNNENDTIVSEELSDNEELLEGLGVKITVNRYERNNVARRKCIEYMGSTCVICGFNFSDFYGDFAKDYIHVHHVVPLSRIKSEYLIDYKKDLVPVCPNCHAMIHFKKDSSYLTIDELRIIIKKKNLDTHK
jgi:5-methylcytosine-specific restriction protein A